MSAGATGWQMKKPVSESLQIWWVSVTDPSRHAFTMVDERWFMARVQMREDEAVELMQMEYAEMPDLKLTFFQAQRLWNLPPELCERALDALVKAAFLVRTSDGAYIRERTGPLQRYRAG